MEPRGLCEKGHFVTNKIVFSFQDPTNLQGKIQKHQAFEAELNANQSRLDAVDTTGEQLIGDDHYASEQIRERLDELHKLWAYLFERSNDKGIIMMISFKIFQLHHANLHAHSQQNFCLLLMHAVIKQKFNGTQCDLEIF